ncbi:Toll-like receptor 7 [Mactra antiquata]
MDCSNSAIELSLTNVCAYISYSARTIRVLRASGLETSTSGILSTLDLNGCENLTELYLNEIDIQQVDNDTFNNFKKLLVLDLSDNDLDLYTGSLNTSLLFPTSLQSLQLTGNYKKVSNGRLGYPDISNLVNLEALYIDGLPLTDFSTSYNSLTKLTNLTMSGHISIGSCNISNVANTTFENTPNVKYLNLSKCLITKIDAFGFGSLTQLETLDLSWNMYLGFAALRNITYGLQYTRINVLNISKLHTTFGPSVEIYVYDLCYLSNTSIKEIDISHNRIETIENNVLNLIPKSLNKMTVRYNKFMFQLFVLQLGCLSNLTEAYAGFNFFSYNPLFFDTEGYGAERSDRYVPNYNCPSLTEKRILNTDKQCPYFKPGEKITLAKHHVILPKDVRKIEYTNSGLKYEIDNMMNFHIGDMVEYADFSSNVLKSWIGPLHSTTNLKHLDLSKNFCSHVDKHFFQFAKDSLQTLQVHTNYIGLALQDNDHGQFIFNNLSVLKTLNLSFNVISSMPKNFLFQSDKIETLDLSYNSIERWTSNVSNLRHLLHLNISNNILHTLPRSLLRRLEKNSERKRSPFTVNMTNNTIIVYCENKDFLDWVIQNRHNMRGFQSYIFFNSDMERLSTDEFMKYVYDLRKACPSYTLIIVICVICISVFLGIVLGGVVYRNRWNLRYIFRNAKLKHFNYQSIHADNERQYTYDVFVSYANEDGNFIRNKIYPWLQQKELRVCLHEKNFIPGKNIADNILDAISNSQITLAILSNDYLSSTWCTYEFNMARMESIYDRDGSTCLSVVLLEDVQTSKMTNEMLHWLRRNTYLEYTTDEQGERCFWEHMEQVVGGGRQHMVNV